MERMREWGIAEPDLFNLCISIPVINKFKVGSLARIFLDGSWIELNPFKASQAIGLPAVVFVDGAFEEQVAVLGHSIVFDHQAHHAVFRI